MPGMFQECRQFGHHVFGGRAGAAHCGHSNGTNVVVLVIQARHEGGVHSLFLNEGA